MNNRIILLIFTLLLASTALRAEVFFKDEASDLQYLALKSVEITPFQDNKTDARVIKRAKNICENHDFKAVVDFDTEELSEANYLMEAHRGYFSKLFAVKSHGIFSQVYPYSFTWVECE